MRRFIHSANVGKKWVSENFGKFVCAALVCLYFGMHILVALPPNYFKVALKTPVSWWGSIFSCEWNLFSKPPFSNYRLYFKFDETLLELLSQDNKLAGDPHFQSITYNHLNFLQMDLIRHFGVVNKEREIEILQNGTANEYLVKRFESGNASWAEFLKRYAKVVAEEHFNGTTLPKSYSIILATRLIPPPMSTKTARESIEDLELIIFQSPVTGF